MTQLEARRIIYLVVSLGTTGWRFESSPVHQTSFAVPFLPLLNQDCCPYGVHTAEGRLVCLPPRPKKYLVTPSTAPNSRLLRNSKSCPQIVWGRILIHYILWSRPAKTEFCTVRIPQTLSKPRSENTLFA